MEFIFLGLRWRDVRSKGINILRKVLKKPDHRYDGRVFEDIIALICESK